MLLGNHEEMMLRALGSPYDTDEMVNDSIIEKALRFWYRGMSHMKSGNA